MLELISSKLCTNDFVTWPQYTFGLSLFVVSMRRFSPSVDTILDDVASSMPSSNAAVQTDARDPTDVLVNMVRAVAAGADVPAQVVVVPSPLPATCGISVKSAFRSSPPSSLLHSRLLNPKLNVSAPIRIDSVEEERKNRILKIICTRFLRHVELPLEGSNFSSSLHNLASEVARTVNRCPAASLTGSLDRALTFCK